MPQTTEEIKKAKEEKELKEVEAEIKAEEENKVSTIPLPINRESIHDKFQDGNNFLVIVNGRERWLTKSGIEVTLQRSASTYNGFTVEFPKGSPYTPPAYYKDLDNCIGCGKR